MAGQPQQGGGGGGGGDNSLDFLWAIVLVIAALLAAWYFGRVYIASIIFKIRYVEILGINFFVQYYAKFAESFHLPIPDMSPLVTAMNAINAGPSKTMSFGIISDISDTVGWYYAFPIAFILVILSYLVFRGNVTAKFRHKHDMFSLKKSELREWPMIHPVGKIDLIKEDINKGPWAMSMTPMIYAKNQKLLIENKGTRPLTVTVDKGASARAFSLQLGPTFSKVQSLPMHVQALFAIFAARANRDRKNSDKLLTQLSTSQASGKLNFSGVKEIVAKHLNTKEVQFVVQRHAYVLTLMASMLDLARSDGVLATSEFLWVKPTDRRLWYMLNSVGRQTPYVEVGGPFCHWLYEKKLGRPLRVPMVEEAVKGLEIAIASIIYEPDDK